MRRREREVTDSEKIDGAITDCYCCRLGFCDEGEVYLVPLSFGYVHRDEERIFYFHGAKKGRKLDLIKKTHSAGFEMDTNYKLKAGETACHYSAHFISIVGTGDVDVVEDKAEKEAALQAIMFQNTGKKDWEFSPEMVEAVCVFRLVVKKLSCKEH